MKALFLYNTLAGRKEEFHPRVEGRVGLYTCGPTVYNYQHLGNLRTYLFEDALKRVLLYDGYAVKHVMNITDVGHLTGDMDMGHDKMEVGAAREGRTVWDIAAYYTATFQHDLERLNILPPDIWCKATDSIPEQIEMIKELERRGYTYQTADGVYFDTSRVEDYNKLSRLPLADLRAGARVEVNPEKRNPTDFALWKFSPAGTKRQMEWTSPWGTGFPGWHIECSAMSLKYLGDQLDIHCGGIDHINIHHTNEIAQSEAATGKKFFDYWLHGAFLNVAGGKKMAKSADNFLTLENALVEKGLPPLAYRFAAFQVHYRKPMEYSEASLRQAAVGLANLLGQVAALSPGRGRVDSGFREKFLAAINNDLNMPKALALVFAVLKSGLSDEDKRATILDFDQVFGLDLSAAQPLRAESQAGLPAAVKSLIEKREEARKARKWAESDRYRDQIRDLGYELDDTAAGPLARPLTQI